MVKIAVDIDSTITKFLDTLKRLGNLDLEYSKVLRWEDLPSICGGVPQMLTLFDQAMSYGEMMKTEIFEGCLDTLRSLESEGIEIHLMTQRPYETLEGTARWARDAGVPHHSLDLAPKLDKIALCQKRGIEVLVDDSPATLQAGIEAGLSMYSLAFPYNRDLMAAAGIPLTENWYQLAEVLNQHRVPVLA